ncbi:MAG: nucleotide-binding protein [Rubrivivax sp.]|nr:nucleotide-binding protein [Rubrivivax sp.]
MKTSRLFFSMPADNWQTPAERELKWGIVKRFERLGYVAEVFTDPRGNADSVAGGQSWSREACEAVMRRCDGCVLLGMRRWQVAAGGPHEAMPSEYNHYEGAVAQMLRLPLVSWVQQGVAPRVVFDRQVAGFMGEIPATPSPQWFKTRHFTVPFGYFRDRLDERRDVFLGYCSSASPVAKALKDYLTRSLDLTVLDWAVDFDPARSIQQEIERAARLCGAGVFLFTRDDKLAKPGAKVRAVPRDNVVYEAGYFAASKGKGRTLIVLQQGAKLPADLGGDIYAELPAGTNIAAVRPVLRKFAEAL